VSAGDVLLDGLPATTLVVGKGGVGKTTCAAALAVRAGERFGSALVISTDPARALPSVLDADVGASDTPVAYGSGVAARILDTAGLRSRFIDRWGTVLRQVLDRGTYLDDADIGPLVDTALPGGDEIFAALELAQRFAATPDASRWFVDTAPTGHTLRLLALPGTLRALLRLLEAMQAKHRFMVRTLTRAYRADDADRFLAELTRLVSALETALRDRSRCAAVLVAGPQRLVMEESRRYLDSLRALGIHVAAVVWNGASAAGAGLDVPAHYVVPRLEKWPVGERGLREWFQAVQRATGRPRPSRPRRAAPLARSAATVADLRPLLRPLTVVAGKGGVGKTTVACALALSDPTPTLLVSTDPAPSLSDALGQEIPDAETPVWDAPGLVARQMDATAAFGRLRQEYASRVDAVFDGLVARGVDLAHDRAVVRDLMALAPPGVDEVYALSLLADALRADDGRRVVVDPAPTGHLLRLLEMPQLALAWTHQLMRLMLKYRDIAGLGDTARELLDFSRDLRALEELLHDPRRCGLVLVTLDEPVVRAETERLAGAVRERGVSVAGVIRNRARTRRASPLPVPESGVHFEAPEVSPPPVGVPALRRWAAAWTTRRSRSPKPRRAR